MKGLKNVAKDCAPTCAKVGAPQSSKVGAPQSAKVGAPQSAKVGAPQSAKAFPSLEDWKHIRTEFEEKQTIIVVAVDCTAMIKSLINYGGTQIIEETKRLEEMARGGWFFFKKLSPFVSIEGGYIAIKWTEKSRIKEPKTGEIFKLIAPVDVYADKGDGTSFASCVLHVFGGYSVDKINPMVSHSFFLLNRVERKKQNNAPRFIMDRDAVDWSAWVLLEYSKREAFTNSESWDNYRKLLNCWKVVHFYPFDLLAPQDLKNCEELANKMRQMLKKNKGGDADANA